MYIVYILPMRNWLPRIQCSIEIN